MQDRAQTFTNNELLKMWQAINKKKRKNVSNKILNNVLQDLKSKIVRKTEQGRTATTEYTSLQEKMIVTSIWILENELSELLKLTLSTEKPDKKKK